MARVCVVHSAVLFFKGCGFFLFLRRDHLMTGVDCHAHAEQRAASEILVSLHQFLAARVEADGAGWNFPQAALAGGGSTRTTNLGGVYDSTAADVESTSVPGRNGDILTENARAGRRRYQNVDIKYKAFFFNGLPAKTAAVKAWLLSPIGYQKLQDTYDPDFFRMAVCKDALVFDVTAQKAAEMELTFNCKPQRWSVDGQRSIRLKSRTTLKNPFAFPAQPIFKVYGDSGGEMYVGEEKITIHSIKDYVLLNCETHNAYNASGFCNETILSDDFPELPEGKTPAQLYYSFPILSEWMCRSDAGVKKPCGFRLPIRCLDGCGIWCDLYAGCSIFVPQLSGRHGCLGAGHLWWGIRMGPIHGQVP